MLAFQTALKSNLRWENFMARYEFQEELVGSGGFGKVRPATDTELDRVVAVKTLDPLVIEFSAAEQERFNRNRQSSAMRTPSCEVVVKRSRLKVKIQKARPFEGGKGQRWQCAMGSTGSDCA